ncbi:MAG: hypothetical protein F6J94_14815 [Moorea sp. SIO1F2]|uniref:hypothetical protein n=1 Tax=Moorena sp. SIO1F2 TaxID=2607819 RepID=UPI0013B98DAA|nr:hypothetical protein [Moorena sp. SIO1F2]NET83149.1 hypothetical protein [Moorena sp. SIO1F2]
MKIKTEEFVALLVGILGAMPPEGDFCKIVKSLAVTDAWADFMDANYSIDGDWQQDMGKLIGELKDKFGDEIDIDEVIAEWKKQAA